jgi:hypothetical protein
MQPFEPAAVITIALEAQQWNLVLAALGEAPYRVSAPLIAAITQQATRGVTANQPATDSE